LIDLSDQLAGIGDGRERPVPCPAPFEAVLQHLYGLGSAIPFDRRRIYYVPSDKWLNEARPEFARNASNNEWLVTVPEPRKVSETLPVYSNDLVTCMSMNGDPSYFRARRVATICSLTGTPTFPKPLGVSCAIISD
jgi:hypothetical protein